MYQKDTIIALATPSGAGAIAVIRLSGPDAIQMVDSVFKSIHAKKLSTQKTHTIHLGHIIDASRPLDEVLVSVFKNPKSYTGEDVIEISCHGSSYIQQEIIQLFVRNGARIANPGEFTLRAFLNAKLDLSQAEAVADLIASDNKASHQIAMQQMRGGFSNEIKALRDELLNFASLIELELDFSEEDVEFADRKQFEDLVARISSVLKHLIDSFSTGNVIKNGIPISIIGAPNVGKSTLLNALLNEDKAIVSAIAGTTRDAIEDELTIEGIKFRFIDTAGIRNTDDTIESIGIKKTFEKITQSQVVLYLLDASKVSPQTVQDFNADIRKIQEHYPDKQLIVVANKMDQADKAFIESSFVYPHTLYTSAKSGLGIESLKAKLLEFVNTGALRNNDTIITNSRHYDSLLKALAEVQKVKQGMDAKLSGDLLAIDIRQALYHFGEITGEITSDDLLGNIFANFCIGK
ncbi:tRNA uridine-5-carboxymethylaminomethyl(34) synthesis GTPase MnmE [Flavobacteriaceae bacterium]|nr:tRNA uridine-5-carboxymethylaminomethyl(34) synthesis GTPase MnmE [Flavobacteriaceae bacterium]MDC1471524.1 tRNA uridine-5-carboxymethylaminomethyl(34) synthesis GTPase MnmE [Flavobacteriaceae bacterium]MDC1539828.1 tRNA uridine-5-carboxymethylaminomethyl(34) synthesis GTPase MnmE [Flavobacteriaceae bacterium]